MNDLKLAVHSFTRYKNILKNAHVIIIEFIMVVRGTIFSLSKINS